MMVTPRKVEDSVFVHTPEMIGFSARELRKGGLGEIPKVIGLLASEVPDLILDSFVELHCHNPQDFGCRALRNADLDQKD